MMCRRFLDPPYHSVRRVFPSTAGRLAFQAVPFWIVSSLSLLAAYAVRRPVCIRPSCTSWSQRLSRTASGRRLDSAPPWRIITPPPQGPSLGFELCCLGPSSLNRPHPSHSWAHRDFTAWRLIRDAFAVRERLGDPRVVPGFRCSFLPDMPSSLTSGSSITVSIQNTDVDIGLRYGPKSSALPIIPQSVSRGARFSRLRWFATATACEGASPPVRI
jgi:hypothetical protein